MLGALALALMAAAGFRELGVEAGQLRPAADGALVDAELAGGGLLGRPGGEQAGSGAQLLPSRLGTVASALTGMFGSLPLGLSLGGDRGVASFGCLTGCLSCRAVADRVANFCRRHSVPAAALMAVGELAVEVGGDGVGILRARVVVGAGQLERDGGADLHRPPATARPAPVS